jgi:hypothetical protein
MVYDFMYYEYLPRGCYCVTNPTKVGCINKIYSLSANICADLIHWPILIWILTCLVAVVPKYTIHYAQPVRFLFNTIHLCLLSIDLLFEYL